MHGFNAVVQRILCLGWAFVFVSLVHPLPAQGGLAVGDQVKGFSLEKTGGGVVQYPQDVAGKVVFLNFWASWCPECKIELPELAKMQESYKDQPFVFLAVSTDRKRKVADRFLKKAGLDIVVLYDSEQKVVNAFGPVGMPASYLIGPSGKVEKVYLGFKKEYIEMYRNDIEALLGNSP